MLIIEFDGAKVRRNSETAIYVEEKFAHIIILLYLCTPKLKQQYESLYRNVSLSVC